MIVKCTRNFMDAHTAKQTLRQVTRKVDDDQKVNKQQITCKVDGGLALLYTCFKYNS